MKLFNTQKLVRFELSLALFGCSAYRIGEKKREREENFLNSQNAFELGKVGF